MIIVVDAIRDRLQSALAALEVATPMSVRQAEMLTEEALEGLRELTDPPNPYKDAGLRPGLVLSQENPDG